MPSFHQLEQLLAIAEHGTLTGAAGALHLSQPALSRSMQRLEDELRVTLFDRQKNRITLNQTERCRRAGAQGSGSARGHGPAHPRL